MFLLSLKKYTVYIFLMIACLPIKAQDYHFELQEINLKDGLPHRTVGDIVQDQEGYIWVSTIGGISRYNGRHFKTYDAESLGISASAFINLAVDKENNIWFVERIEMGKIGAGGVLNPTLDKVYTINDYTKGKLQAQDLISLNKSSAAPKEWFVTTQQGVVYKYADSLQVIFNFPNKINLNIYCNQAPNGDYWIAHFGEIFHVKNQQIVQTIKTDDQFYSIKSFQPQPIFEREVLFEKKTCAVLQAGKLSPYPLQTIQGETINSIIHLGNQLDYYTIDDYKTLIIQDKAGNPLLQYERPEEARALANIFHFNILEDQQGILWIGTGNGLLKIVKKENPFTTFLPNNSTRGIYFEGQKKWIGSYSTSLFPDSRKVGNGWEKTSAVPITQFSKDAKGQLWIGTTSAYLIQYLPEQNEHRLYYFKDKLDLYCPFYNKTLQQLWIGTNHGLVRFDESAKTLQPIPLSMDARNVNVRQIYENEAGIWVVSSKGLFLIDNKTAEVLQHYQGDHLLPHKNLNYLYEDPDGIFWLASKGGGLIKWNPKTNNIQQFRQENGLSNNVIYAIYEDDYKKLWLPSNYGLMAFDKVTNSTKVYLPQHGIAHEEFNTYSHFKAADGTLYFGGLNGITKFHPRDLKDKKQDHTPLYLTKIELLSAGENNFQEYTATYREDKQITLANDFQILEIELSLLDFESVTDNQYAYKIQGHQDQWTYTTDPKISIFQIPHGNYTLQFIAKGSTGTWSTNTLQIPLVVQAPFYLQFWFFVSGYFLTIALIFGIITYREIRFQKNRKQLEQEVQKRTFELAEEKAITVRQAEKLKQLDQTKSRFFSNITHEFRTPLTLIIGPIQQVMAMTKENSTKQRLSGALKNAHSILGLINQLLDISKLEAGQMKIEISQGNLLAYTQQLIDGFKPLVDEKRQQIFLLSKDKHWDLSFDKEKWEKIIYNLLFNAIKFTPAEGLIQLYLTQTQKLGKDWINLRISDTGIGIATEQIPEVFNRFYQIDDSSTRKQEGTGIGLALVKELVTLLGGNIQVISKINQGTTFEIQLPLLAANLAEKTNSFIPEDAFLPTPEQPLENTKEVVDNSKEKLQVLIVEDNLEMQRYIYSCIPVEKYAITLANNGQEGIQKALSLIPDLIISDVMMPIKNGFDLTAEIRSTIATSHIPIILLTAKAALESRLEGIAKGADVYLTKPFSPKELTLRIEKLIEFRQLLQKRYANSISSLEKLSHKKEIEKEDRFITEVKTFVLKHIDNPELNGEMISAYFKISRMQLHRKIKALTNQSTSQLIKNIRFELAFTLLKQNSLNVSEIAYQTGFSTPKQFSIAFKRKFGKTPSSVMKGG